ncbi:uncharacterized protein LOC120204312 [Hibiscus syriacus]|uniref:uncharacterized protein LOC120204312 n=1 Tax=Hibiscus syriacus TaxID=106335 RepID=UPI0019210030|nr:uncharacterized protein LOC120204312 [Hibiscus syriacus]
MGPKISHIFFADDLLLFVEAKTDQLICIQECLKEFSQAWGLKVNLHKSKLFVSLNINLENSNILSDVCGIPLTDDLRTYLGVLIIHKRANTGTYASRQGDAKTGRLERKGSLNGEKKSLVQSVTAAITVHTMQTATQPTTMCNKINSVNRNFLWAGGTDYAHNHLVSWDKICNSKYQGGLCTKNKINEFSIDGKNDWRIYNRQETLWCKEFREKYLKQTNFLKTRKQGSSTEDSQSDTESGENEQCLGRALRSSAGTDFDEILGATNIIVEMDAKWLVNDELMEDHPSNVLVKDCKELQREWWVSEIRHIGGKVTDARTV